MEGADKVREQLSGIEEYAKKNKTALKDAGIALTAFGAGATAVLGLATKAAMSQEQSISELDAALKNVGTSYSVVKGGLEDVIEAMVKKTAYSDEEQRKALGELITYTGNYNKALGLLGLSLDVAAGAHKDLSTATLAVGKAAQGEVSALTRVGIIMDKDATAAEALAKAQNTLRWTS